MRLRIKVLDLMPGGESRFLCRLVSLLTCKGRPVSSGHDGRDQPDAVRLDLGQTSDRISECERRLSARCIRLTFQLHADIAARCKSLSEKQAQLLETEGSVAEGVVDLEMASLPNSWSAKDELN